MGTVYKTADAYFAQHTLRPIWAGGKFKTYLAPHVAVKVLSHTKMTLSTMVIQAKGSPSPNALFDQLFRLKEQLGTHVVPFEIPDEISCRVRSFGRLLWLWPEKMILHHPVVQLRVDKNVVLPNHLARLRNEGNFGEIQSTLDSAFSVMENLVRCGYFLHDNLPDNFCFLDGAVKLLDLGAVRRMGKNIRGVLTGDEKIRGKYIERNCGVWINAIQGGVPPDTGPEFDRISEHFWSKFDGFNTWNHVHQLQARGQRRNGKGRKNGANGMRVQDVFPLST